MNSRMNYRTHVEVAFYISPSFPRTKASRGICGQTIEVAVNGRDLKWVFLGAETRALRVLAGMKIAGKDFAALTPEDLTLGSVELLGSPGSSDEGFHAARRAGREAYHAAGGRVTVDDADHLIWEARD